MQKSLVTYTLILAAFLTIAVFASSTQEEDKSKYGDGCRFGAAICTWCH